MLVHRKILLAVALLLVAGSICGTAGYALHLRSDAYRAAVVSDVAAWLGMDVSIGAVRPLSRTSRGFRDVAVRLNGNRGEQVFSCSRAAWRERPGSGGAANVLELHDGWLLVGSGAWGRSDYERMLAGGLGHSFTEINLSEVELTDIDLRFVHPVMTFRADDARGVLQFAEDGHGTAAVTCMEFNGAAATQPVRIAARFTPGQEVVFDQIILHVPDLPLDALGLCAVGGTAARGTFSGDVEYDRGANVETLIVRGGLFDADLRGLTAPLPGGPYHGEVNVSVDTAVFRGRRLERVELFGELAGLRVGQIVPGLAPAGGGDELNLYVDQMRWGNGRLEFLSGRGYCNGVSLDALTELIGEGNATGTARLRIDSLLIVDERIEWADVTIEAEPPPDVPGTIDQALLASAGKRLLGVDVSALLPEQVEYRRIGARVVINKERMRVYGTHGPDRDTIVTVHLFGRDVGVIRAPERTFEVPDLMALLRQQAERVQPEDVRRTWERIQTRRDRMPPPPP